MPQPEATVQSIAIAARNLTCSERFTEAVLTGRDCERRALSFINIIQELTRVHGVR